MACGTKEGSGPSQHRRWTERAIRDRMTRLLHRNELWRSQRSRTSSGGRRGPSPDCFWSRTAQRQCDRQRPIGLGVSPPLGVWVLTFVSIRKPAPLRLNAAYTSMPTVGRRIASASRRHADGRGWCRRCTSTVLPPICRVRACRVHRHRPRDRSTIAGKLSIPLESLLYG